MNHDETKQTKRTQRSPLFDKLDKFLRANFNDVSLIALNEYEGSGQGSGSYISALVQSRKADKRIENICKNYLEQHIKDKAIRVSIMQPEGFPLPRKIVLIASCKGGVGKSTVSLLLSLLLHQRGVKVGLLDADIHGPSMRRMLNMEDLRYEDGKIQPYMHNGMPCVSLGQVTHKSGPALWRGIMTAKAIMDLYSKTSWGNISTLIVDMPPGTGDIAISICKKMMPTCAVLVQTPQSISTDEVISSIVMFRKLEVPILGRVNNMTHMICPCCGESVKLFPQAPDSEQNTELASVPILDTMPFIPNLAEHMDAGSIQSFLDKGSNLLGDLADSVLGALKEDPLAAKRSPPT